MRLERGRCGKGWSAWCGKKMDLWQVRPGLVHTQKRRSGLTWTWICEGCSWIVLWESSSCGTPEQWCSMVTCLRPGWQGMCQNELACVGVCVRVFVAHKALRMMVSRDMRVMVSSWNTQELVQSMPYIASITNMTLLTSVWRKNILSALGLTHFWGQIASLQLFRFNCVWVCKSSYFCHKLIHI